MNNKLLVFSVSGFLIMSGFYCGAIIFKSWNQELVERNFPAAWLECLPGLQPVRPSGQTYDESTKKMYRNTKFVGFETGAN